MRILTLIIFIGFLVSCQEKSSKKRTFQTISKENMRTVDSTDGLSLSRIEKGTIYDDKIKGLWTSNPGAMHAEFILNDSSIILIDHEGERIPYTVKNNVIIVHYPNYNEDGLILSATNDSLVVDWKNNGKPTIYTRWRNR